MSKSNLCVKVSYDIDQYMFQAMLIHSLYRYTYVLCTYECAQCIKLQLHSTNDQKLFNHRFLTVQVLVLSLASFKRHSALE